MPLVAHLRALVVATHVLLMVASVFVGKPDVRTPDTVLDWYAACCGVSQRWYMFKGVSANTARLEIAVLEGGVERDLYVERSADATWNREAFDHYRWREVMNAFRRGKQPRGWPSFVRWTRARVFEEFPDVDRVRVRVMRASLAPADAPRPPHYRTQVRQSLTYRPR